MSKKRKARNVEVTGKRGETSHLSKRRKDPEVYQSYREHNDLISIGRLPDDVLIEIFHCHVARHFVKAQTSMREKINSVKLAGNSSGFFCVSAPPSRQYDCPRRFHNWWDIVYVCRRWWQIVCITPALFGPLVFSPKKSSNKFIRMALRKLEGNLIPTEIRIEDRTLTEPDVKYIHLMFKTFPRARSATLSMPRRI
ncbi:hypothetical protein C8Q75DRAFT_580703 [Abortiporus biennis]|nr:hypothetical protein C8Q75DRAFT_580703 [Abortiporus biennis]